MGFFEQKPSKVAITILAWNNLSDLIKCLSFLKAQTYKEFEVICVANSPISDHLENLIAVGLQQDLHIEPLPTNLGFASANNLGARLAHGKWLALLNADAFPEPEWLEKIVRAAEKNPDYSFFSSRQIQANSIEYLDGAGDTYHISGLAWRNGYNYPVNSHGKEQREVFSACAAAALISREEFLALGGFDEDYFSYFEDVDFGFRLRLAGKKCLYVPEAVVHHVGSASTGKRSDFSVYHGYRNMIWTFVKDMPTPLFWLFLPLHLGTLLLFVIYLTWRGQGSTILRAIRDAIRGLPKMIGKRKVIQKNRKVRSRDLLHVMSTGLLEPYREFMQRNKKLA